MVAYQNGRPHTDQYWLDEESHAILMKAKVSIDLSLQLT